MSLLWLATWDEGRGGEGRDTIQNWVGTTLALALALALALDQSASAPKFQANPTPPFRSRKLSAGPVDLEILSCDRLTAESRHELMDGWMDWMVEENLNDENLQVTT
ncbi:hypothetical protein VTL71DRAFT_4165 [Oculimacula yallundae]|uniref:Uncharacterized protein n=1 Tax=Oculimacula yallundae TaxID=86028 RepID=A0ABR4C511_9HELO